MAMKQGIIPPNLHFENLSARVAPHYKHLEVPTTAKPWPKTLPGQPRRVSVNSFGESTRDAIHGQQEASKAWLI